jgi:glycosyltransferase involved in cell wall biosynthesis
VKILLVHNEYGKFSGEEAVVQSLSRLLAEHGHQVHHFSRSSANIPDMRLGEIRAFFSGIYSFSSKKAMRQYLREFKPDIVHIHNLFPLISPSILPVCRKAGIPVVMTVHNYRLVCPNGLHMTHGQICEKCSGGKEWWCVIRNCEGSFFKSFGYALRNYIARTLRLFHDNVAIYACLTEFQRQKLIDAGFQESRIVVIPNMCNVQGAESATNGEYVGFVGRISPEKGIDVLLQCAKILKHIPFKVAGDFESDICKSAPPNVEFCGFLQGDDLDMFRQQMRIAVMPSIWYETFGLVLAEAASYGKPVIVSRLGAMAEIVEDGRTGLHFEPGNAEDLAEKIQYLWDNPDMCKEMGRAGRAKVLREYSSEKYYQRLMDVYNKVLDSSHGAG